ISSSSSLPSRRPGTFGFDCLDLGCGSNPAQLSRIPRAPMQPGASVEQPAECANVLPSGPGPQAQASGAVLSPAARFRSERIGDGSCTFRLCKCELLCPLCGRLRQLQPGCADTPPRVLHGDTDPRRACWGLC